MPASRAAWLFPERSRHFAGERWINIALRCLHLVGVAGMSGGFLFDLAASEWSFYWYLAIATGAALALLYLWNSATWLFELKGLAILFKLALLAIAAALPSLRGEVFVVVIVLSGLVAHAPARVRGWRWSSLPGSRFDR
ncbi:MAG: hypothetical protein KDI88_10715 [Gammaproteobacteria bacterium]|nr:hypothetical protein [Gammaproteobacteria bacterium]